MIKTFLSLLLLSFVLLFAGLVLTLLRWNRLQKTERCSLSLLVLGITVLFIFSLPIVSFNMADYLERDYRSYDRSGIKPIDVVVVLAGGLNQGQDVIQDELTGLTYSRTVAGIRAFKSSNARIIIMSGGAGNLQDIRMVSLMRSIAVEMGVPAARIRVDPLSRNTFEHPMKIIDLPEINRNDKIGVVTSAWHLPRAMAEFRRYFPNAVAIPCDYGGFGSTNVWLNFIPSVGALEKNTTIMHEYIGRCWYLIRHACEDN